MFVRHKTLHIDPKLVLKAGIKVTRVEQQAGDMVITNPRAYHTGYNTGYNVAEAANFGHDSWLEYAKKVKECTCMERHNCSGLINKELFTRFVVSTNKK